LPAAADAPPLSACANGNRSNAKISAVTVVRLSGVGTGAFYTKGGFFRFFGFKRLLPALRT
jgi:hypothetical protein